MKPCLPVVFRIGGGSLELVKWLALVLMTIDHINKYMLDGAVAWAFNVGRVAAPLFAAVLGYNLAHFLTAQAASSDVQQRVRTVFDRLILFAVLASPPFIILGKLHWSIFPLNILFTLAAATGVIALMIQGRRLLALSVFIAAGVIVEYAWFMMLVVLATWHFARQPNWLRLGGVVGAVYLLYLVNQNHWAMAALPILCLASRIDWPVPRSRWLFYAYYPLHLWVLCSCLQIRAVSS